jgi:hypothetical protein
MSLGWCLFLSEFDLMWLQISAFFILGATGVCSHSAEITRKANYQRFQSDSRSYSCIP